MKHAIKQPFHAYGIPPMGYIARYVISDEILVQFRPGQYKKSRPIWHSVQYIPILYCTGSHEITDKYQAFKCVPEIITFHFQNIVIL